MTFEDAVTATEASRATAVLRQAEVAAVVLAAPHGFVHFLATGSAEQVQRTYPAQFYMVRADQAVEVAHRVVELSRHGAAAPGWRAFSP